MEYMTKTQLAKAYDNGWLDEVKNQCVKYGIVKIKDWEVNDIPRYNGAWRLYYITHHNIQWIIKMHNGEIVSVERNHNSHKIF